MRYYHSAAPDRAIEAQQCLMDKLGFYFVALEESVENNEVIHGSPLGMCRIIREATIEEIKTLDKVMAENDFEPRTFSNVYIISID